MSTKGDGIAVHHFIEKFLPYRQAYISTLLQSLDLVGVRSRVYTYGRENSEAFPNHEVVALDDIGQLRKRALEVGWKLGKTKSYLAQLCTEDVLERRAIHHSHFFSTSSCCYDVKKRTSNPFVLTLYGEDEIFHAVNGVADKSVMERIELVDKYSDLILVPSEFYFSIVSRVFPRKKIKLLKIGVDCSAFVPNGHDSNLDKDGQRILCVARLTKRKGLRHLIDAIPVVLKEYPGAQLTVVGEGDAKDALVMQAKGLGVEGSVRFMPYQKSLTSIYSGADVFVFPSLVTEDGITEGLGVSLLEAQASGLPVIASRVGGIPEAVNDGVTGFLVEPGDSAQIAEGLLKLLSDSDLRMKFGKEGVQKVNNEFNVAMQSVALREIYAGLGSA